MYTTYSSSIVTLAVCMLNPTVNSCDIETCRDIALNFHFNLIDAVKFYLTFACTILIKINYLSRTLALTSSI